MNSKEMNSKKLVCVLGVPMAMFAFLLTEAITGSVMLGFAGFTLAMILIYGLISSTIPVVLLTISAADPFMWAGVGIGTSLALVTVLLSRSWEPPFRTVLRDWVRTHGQRVPLRDK